MTKKPCPGCGTVKHYRQAGKVCANCARAIEQWNNYTASVKMNKETVAVYLKDAPHWYPMFYFGGSADDVTAELRDTLADSFWLIAPMVCKEVIGSNSLQGADAVPLYKKEPVRIDDGSSYGRHISYPTSDGESGGASNIGIMDKNVFNLLNTLWDSTARFAHFAYLCGLKNGQNVLTRLATGELSISDFQEKEIRLAQEVQDAKLMHQELKKKRRGYK